MSSSRAVVSFAVPFMLAACGAPDAKTPASTAASSSSASAATSTTASVQDFTTRDLDGKTVRLSDHLGKKVILIDFWATYCKPCLAAFPHIRRIHTANSAKGFVVLAIAMDGPDTMGEVPAFAKRNNLDFPVLYDEDSRIASILNPKKSEPLVILIDKSGKVVRVREGYNPGDEKLFEADVTRLVAGQAVE